MISILHGVGALLIFTSIALFIFLAYVAPFDWLYKRSKFLAYLYLIGAPILTGIYFLSL
jgi:hypothetical protein